MPGHLYRPGYLRPFAGHSRCTGYPGCHPQPCDSQGQGASDLDLDAGSLSNAYTNACIDHRDTAPCPDAYLFADVAAPCHDGCCSNARPRADVAAQRHTGRYPGSDLDTDLTTPRHTVRGPSGQPDADINIHDHSLQYLHNDTDPDAEPHPNAPHAPARLCVQPRRQL